MTEIDTAGAADALRAAAALDAADSAVPSQSTEQAPQTTEPVTTTGQETESNQPTGLFHDVDPAKLSPEMRTIFDGMQKSYTQKTQELASKSREYDGLGNAEQVKSAVEFVQALQDPTNLVQLQSEISDYLQSIGYSKSASDAAAADTFGDNQDASFNEFEDTPSATDPAIERQLQELQSFKEQYEQEKLQADIEAVLTRQENIIRNQNPTYTDDDIQTVYQLSYAYGGDLMSAQKAYEGERQRILAGYAAAKSSVTDAAGSPAVGAHAQAPTDLTDWRAATDYAKRRLAALDGLGALDN